MGLKKIKSAETLGGAEPFPWPTPQIHLPLLKPAGMQHLRGSSQKAALKHAYSQELPSFQPKLFEGQLSKFVLTPVLSLQLE